MDQINPFEKYTAATSLMDLGYRDYIAARLLLNHHQIIQGLTLASTAVEKYLKAIIVLSIKENERYHVHMDNVKKLEAILVKNKVKVFEKLDPLFLEILQDIYKIRYYDKLKTPIYIGLFINQFIGELDWTVDFFESYINPDGMRTQYRSAIEKKDPDLFKNNFVLGGKDKKKFMEKIDIGFSVYVMAQGVRHDERVVKGGSYRNKYDGRIAEFKEFKPEWVDYFR